MPQITTKKGRVFTWVSYVGKPVVIESQNRNRRTCFKNVFSCCDGKNYVFYQGFSYEHIGACPMSGKMMFKKSENQFNFDDKKVG